MRYALDTDTIAYFLRGEGRVAERLLAQKPSAVAVPAIVVYEIEYGLARADANPARRAAAAALLAPLRILPFDEAAAREAGRLRARLEAAGRPVGPADLMIAATVRAHGCTLVTRNVAEFARIEGLAVENWY